MASKNLHLPLRGWVLRNCIKPSAHKRIVLSFRSFSPEGSKHTSPKPADWNCYRLSWAPARVFLPSVTPANRMRPSLIQKQRTVSLFDQLKWCGVSPHPGALAVPLKCHGCGCFIRTRDSLSWKAAELSRGCAAHARTGAQRLARRRCRHLEFSIARSCSVRNSGLKCWLQGFCM